MPKGRKEDFKTINNYTGTEKTVVKKDTKPSYEMDRIKREVASDYIKKDYGTKESKRLGEVVAAKYFGNMAKVDKKASPTKKK